MDWPAWDRLLDFHVREGTDGIVIAGTTGESPALTLEEIEELTPPGGGTLQRQAEGDRGRRDALDRRARWRGRAHLSRLGVDAVMLVTPYYNKPPQEGLYRHFMAAADASKCPVILYNVPSRTAVDLLPATVARLARHPQIVALKEASADLSRARELLALCPPEFTLLSGDDATAIDWMARARTGSSRSPPTSRRAACARRARRRSAAIWRAARGHRCRIAAPAQGFVRRSEPDSGKMGGCENGPHRERNTLAIGRIVAGAPGNGAARDAGGRE